MDAPRRKASTRPAALPGGTHATRWCPLASGHRRRNALTYKSTKYGRQGEAERKGRKAETTGGEEAQWVANAKVRRGVRRASSERKAASESKNRRIMIPHPSRVRSAITLHGNCLTYICVTLARFVHAHTHGLHRRGLHTNLLSSRRPTSATRVALGAGPCQPNVTSMDRCMSTQCLQHVLGNACAASFDFKACSMWFVGC